MKILLANIGNRNITLKGQVFQNTGSPLSFRDWSKELLDNYESKKIDLNINIINPLIDLKNGFNKLILYYSDMSQFDTRTDQDTIFETQIIKKLLIDKYYYSPEIIELRHITTIVIDNGGLMKYFGEELRNIKKENPEAKITICDAGGTAQQKMALKVMAEYILDAGQYNIKYTENNILVTDVNINEYRNIISKEQAIALIKIGEYQAAGDILNFDIPNAHLSKNWQEKIFGHVALRFRSNHNLAIKCLNSRRKVENPILSKYLNGEPLSNNSNLLEYFGTQEYFKITELFYKIVFYINLCNYTESVLTFAHFYEIFLEKFLQKFLPEIKFGKLHNQNEEQKRNMESYFKKLYPDFCLKNPKFRIELDSIMTQVMFMKTSENEELKKIAEIISPYMTYTDDSVKQNHINTLRNKIAHEGKYLSEKEVNLNFKYYPKMIGEIGKILKLDIDDLYEELNKILENNLRQ